MKKFRFDLETVLVYRTHLEEKEKQLLASMRLFYEHEQGRLSSMQAQYARVQEELAAREALRFDKVESNLYRAYLRRSAALIQSKRNQLDALQAQMDKQKQVVIQIYTHRRILELLKAQQWRAHTLAVDKEIQQLVDELQLAKYHPGRVNE